MSLCLHRLCMYPTYCVLQCRVLHVMRYTTFLDALLSLSGKSIDIP